MKKSIRNTFLLAAIAIAVAGAGYYDTQVRQPKIVERLDKQQEEARLRNLKAEELLVAVAGTAEKADESLRKWRARFKFVPDQMATPDIVDYLEGLTSSGFDKILIDLVGVTTKPDFSYYTFKISGTGYFRNVYDFVWHLENNREFYHVRDLNLKYTEVTDKNQETGRAKRLDMVTFSLQLNAYFKGVEGLSTPDTGLPRIPVWLLPAHAPQQDSFFPVVRTGLPPNDRMLVEVESDQLISIVGDKAVFQNANGQHMLGEGDEVYLGSIMRIDPMNATVRASLNKGGMIDIVEIKLATPELHESDARQRGRMAPVDSR